MEKVCFELENIEVSYLDKEVMKIERLAVHQFDRIGIVGKNGAGKSTLLQLLADKLKPTSGKVHQYVEPGYFEQLAVSTRNEADIALLSRLAVPTNTDSLSGGEQTRLKLAQLFSYYHEALLIDEPTTHLDGEGITFLREELTYYYGALLLISHDRILLDELVTTIWEVRDGEVHVYKGNYSEYIAQKQLEREQQQEGHERFLKEKNRLERAAADKMKKARKVAQAGSMSKKESKSLANRMIETKSKGTSQKALHRAAKAIEQRMAKLEEVEAVCNERHIVFRQSEVLAMHNKFPLMAEQLKLEINDRVLVEDVNFQFPLGKTIAVIGANGIGKSTLLRHIAHNGSNLIISPKAKIGYFRQMSYHFSSDETVLEFVKSRSDYEEVFLRTVLHSMQFVGTDLLKSVHSLSGGEAIRLQLCLLFLGEYNILLLDEPTNFLDIHAIEALERFMKGYKGTIVFVSHDRAFIQNVADLQYRIHEKNMIQV
ncbi:Msr family ABC-F type ribosomal protection protein [Priestia taiwanensis]|uniref:Msr family ABC-F type ribosomal protection protein n=1 Tax=Priestia taiwanensis TaxID=1347902 RepID=A0A917AN77_9BACI|nr:ABC-F type ribosomal protection protein [Priestia taiwanensis]MBM7362378.1 macrolide transport system ATP-binding/permease protein [Priestia taiwanensis]GGE61693.1 Msr family ABC-F type ribosomal protection protein [Priestia taiwanensis]